MKEELKEIILMETEAIEKLLKALDDQYIFIIKKDIFRMEGCLKEIVDCNKSVAEWEVKRRAVTKGEAMSHIISSLKDDELDKSFRNIIKLLHEVKLQKDTNELLIKQGLGYTTRMLGILNPDRSMKTYNSYGKVKR